MKKTLIATAGFLAVGGAAVANDDVTFDFGTFTLFGGESISFDITLPPNDKAVTGFLFEGFYDDLADDASWASDMQMVIEGPDGGSYSIGGFDNPGDGIWDFDGADEDGFYTHDGTGALDGFGKGDYTVTFINDWAASGGHTWSDVSVTFLKVPAPGALAMLGLAGLAGSRRRRG